jgi:hypothetical protein
MEKARVEGGRKYKGVGVMKDKEVNLEEIEEEGLLRWLKFIINR